MITASYGRFEPVLSDTVTLPACLPAWVLLVGTVLMSHLICMLGQLLSTPLITTTPPEGESGETRALASLCVPRGRLGSKHTIVDQAPRLLPQPSAGLCKVLFRKKGLCYSIFVIVQRYLTLTANGLFL